jgi:hypothetical protein
MNHETQTPTKARKAFAVDNIGTNATCPDCGAGTETRAAPIVMLDRHPDDTGQGVAVPCPVCARGLDKVLVSEAAQNEAIDNKRAYTGLRSFWAPTRDVATKQANKVSWNNGRTLRGRYCLACKEWETWEQHTQCLAGTKTNAVQLPRVRAV